MRNRFSQSNIFLSLVVFAFTFILLAPPCRALDIKVKDVAGTENGDGLTDKQLAIQRWFAGLTYLNTAGDGWNGWYKHYDQLGLYSYRYSLAFLGYAAGAQAYKTPAYTEVAAQIIDNVIQRLIQKKVWDFIERYWKDNPVFPDPVAYENIMYSGHLAQMIALYESLTGDMKYEEAGWDFVWDEKTRIHYTGRKLMEAIYKQVQDDPRGGVPCEPNTIFIICNDHPQIAFLLFDAMHGTHYGDLAGKWRAWMEKEGKVTRLTGKGYLKVSFLRDREMWTTAFGMPGSDGWALTWMYPWNDNLDFVCDGWKNLSQDPHWKKPKTGGAFLKADTMSGCFGVDDASGTSFYPLLEAQCNSSGDSRARDVYAYFESLHGTAEDTDNDGLAESYFYNSGKETRVWVTANLAAAMATRGDSLRRMYRIPFFKAHAGEPALAHAPYPQVMVKKAEYLADKKTLTFTLVNGAAAATGDVKLVCRNIRGVKSATRNGKTFKNYKLKKGVLLLTTKIENPTVFKIKVKVK